MLQVRSWPTVILHLDGDAFFVSVLQAVNPKLRGKPVVTGAERGIATAISYEAKKYGITRATRISEARKLCPNLIVLDSNYELFSLFSTKMFDILRSFSPHVEEYSIDEAFADLKGLRRPLNMTYDEIGAAVKNKIEGSLGISISVGISLTKSLAKLCSNFRKPSGLTVVSGMNIEKLLAKTKVIDIWGVGENTGAYLNKLGIKTALEFTSKSEEFIRKYFNKSVLEIWTELRGNKVYELDTAKKSSYKSMQSTQTFNSPTNDPNLLWSRLLEHVEEVFQRARQLDYKAGRLQIFLKTQQFRYLSTEIKFTQPTTLPVMVRNEIKKAFEKIYDKKFVYRTTGCTLSDFSETTITQDSLFTDRTVEEKAKKVYPLLDKKKVFFGSSLYEKRQSQSKKSRSKFAIPVISV